MWADILSSVVTKRTAPYVIWTSVFLVCAIYFWLSTRSPQKSDATDSRGGSHSNRRGGKAKREVSVQLDGTLLRASCSSGGGGTDGASSSSSSGGDALAPVEIQDAAVAPFLELCSKCEVFAFALASDDQREAAVRQACEQIGAFDSGLKRHRLMFSSSDTGRASMVRQLQPAVHFEVMPVVAESLAGKVPELRLIGSSDWPSFHDGSCLRDLCC